MRRICLREAAGRLNAHTSKRLYRPYVAYQTRPLTQLSGDAWPHLRFSAGFLPCGQRLVSYASIASTIASSSCCLGELSVRPEIVGASN